MSITLSSLASFISRIASYSSGVITFFLHRYRQNLRISYNLWLIVVATLIQSDFSHDINSTIFLGLNSDDRIDHEDYPVFGLKVCHKQVYTISVRGNCISIAIPDAWKIAPHKLLHKLYKPEIFCINLHHSAPLP